MNFKNIGIAFLMISAGLQACEKQEKKEGLITKADVVKGGALLASAYYLFPSSQVVTRFNATIPLATTLLGKAQLANVPGQEAAGLGKLVTPLFNFSRVVITAAGALKVLDICGKFFNALVDRELIPAVPQL